MMIETSNIIWKHKRNSSYLCAARQEKWGKISYRVWWSYEPGSAWTGPLPFELRKYRQETDPVGVRIRREVIVEEAERTGDFVKVRVRGEWPKHEG